jgi:K+-sensing histidine kinase KdpD
MTQGRLRLHHRIAIPFALLALLATSVAALVAVSAISRTLQTRIETQVLNTSAVVGQSDFALNAAILRSAKAITGADIITYTSDGNVVATTVERGPGAQSLVAAVTAPDATRTGLAGGTGTGIVRKMDCGKPCLVVYRRLTTRPDTVVAVVADTSEMAAATRQLVLTVLLGAGFSLLVMIVLGQVITRRVTAPIDEALVRSEKLALAGLMAARVAHDIRNPLSSIKMQTQLVGARLRGDAETQAQVGAVLRDIQQVETVVKDLIELARPGELRPRAMPLNDVVRDVLTQLFSPMTSADQQAALEQRIVLAVAVAVVGIRPLLDRAPVLEIGHRLDGVVDVTIDSDEILKGRRRQYDVARQRRDCGAFAYVRRAKFDPANGSTRFGHDVNVGELVTASHRACRRQGSHRHKRRRDVVISFSHRRASGT